MSAKPLFHFDVVFLVVRENFADAEIASDYFERQSEWAGVCWSRCRCNKACKMTEDMAQSAAEHEEANEEVEEDENEDWLLTRWDSQYEDC